MFVHSESILKVCQGPLLITGWHAIDAMVLPGELLAIKKHRMLL